MGVAETFAVMPAPPTTVTDVVAEQLLASVTVKVYVPADRMNAPVPEYGGVPPVAATVTVALPVLQEVEVAFALAESRVGSVMVTDTVPLHPFASVTRKLCVPAE